MKSGKRKSGSGAKAPAKTAKRAVPAATKRDARKAAPPTASASVAKKAAEAIAPVAAVATAAPKAVEKLVPATPVPTPASVEPVAKLATQAAVLAFNPVAAVAPFATAFEAGADQARASYSRARENGESLRQAVTDSTTATTRAFVELNGKVIDLVRAQSDATLAEVVDLKFFCGFSFAEIATLRQTSERTVQRQWEKARIYLHRSLRSDELDQ